MKNSSAKKIATTALFLALLIAVQQFKAIQFITGPLVNAILIITAVWIGLYSGLVIAVLSPIFAAIITPALPMQLLPQMIPVIMAGNAIIVIAAYIFRNKSLKLGLIVGAVTKALLLWAGVSLLVIPMFGSGLNSADVKMLTAIFSYMQLITALAGSVIALLILPRLKKIP